MSTWEVPLSVQQRLHCGNWADAAWGADAAWARAHGESGHELPGALRGLRPQAVAVSLKRFRVP